MINLNDLVEEIDIAGVQELTEPVLASCVEMVAPSYVLYHSGLKEWEPKTAEDSLMKDLKPILKDHPNLSEDTVRYELRKEFRAILGDEPDEDELVDPYDHLYDVEEKEQY